MIGKAKIPDTASGLLFLQIVQYALLQIEAVKILTLIQIMQEIIIKVLHPAAIQLFLKYFLSPCRTVQLKTGHLVRQDIAVTRILFQHPAKELF